MITESEGLRRVQAMRLKERRETFEEGDVCQKYRILGPPDWGGHAEVYAAVRVGEEDHGEKVALKVMRGNASWDALRASFGFEAHMLTQLKGVENVPHLYDQGTLPSGQGFLVMTWLEGADLRFLLDFNEPLSGECLLVIARDVAKALVGMHKVGIVHRDLNPRNILFQYDPYPSATVCDFGISADLGLEENLRPVEGQRFGTDGFVSPEQSIDAKPHRSADIWSFGAILLNLAAGKPPQESKIYHGNFPKQPEDQQRALLYTLALQCLVIDPKERPPADRLLDLLEAALLKRGHTQPSPGASAALEDAETESNKTILRILPVQTERTDIAFRPAKPMTERVEISKDDDSKASSSDDFVATPESSPSLPPRELATSPPFRAATDPSPRLWRVVPLAVLLMGALVGVTWNVGWLQANTSNDDASLIKVVPAGALRTESLARTQAPTVSQPRKDRLKPVDDPHQDDVVPVDTQDRTTTADKATKDSAMTTDKTAKGSTMTKPVKPKTHTRRRSARPIVDCDDVMSRVTMAKRQRDTNALLQLSKTSHRHCWPSSEAWREDRLDALTTSERYDECLELTKHSNGSASKMYRSFCEKATR